MSLERPLGDSANLPNVKFGDLKGKMRSLAEEVASDFREKTELSFRLTKRTSLPYLVNLSGRLNKRKKKERELLKKVEKLVMMCARTHQKPISHGPHPGAKSPRRFFSRKARSLKDASGKLGEELAPRTARVKFLERASSHADKLRAEGEGDPYSIGSLSRMRAMGEIHAHYDSEIAEEAIPAARKACETLRKLDAAMRELPPLEYEEPKLRERKSQLERIRNDFSGSPDISMYRTSSAIRSLEATLSREPAYPYEKLLESALREISGVREEAEKNLNMLLLKAGKIDEALSVAKDSANLNWGANKLLLRTALAYLVKGKNREAADIVGKLYAKRKWGEQPEHWDVSEAHGNGWMVLSDVRHELDMIEYAIVITDLAGMEKEHGNILLSVGRAMSAEVKESIAREYMMEPFDTPRHLVRLAIIYHEAGADAKAREHLSRAFSEAARQSSNEAQYLLFEMASLQLDFGFREDALKTIGAINPPQDWNSYSGFSSDPSFDEVSDCRISAYARLVARAGLFEEADKLASRIPTYYKPRIDVLAKAGIAVLKFKAGKEKEALRRLKRFPLLSARKNPRALMGFALAQAQVGLTKKAKSSFAKAASVIRKEKSEVRRARLLAYLGVKQAEAGFLPDSDASFGAMENTLTSDDITSVVSPNYLFSAYLSAAKGIESAKSA